MIFRLLLLLVVGYLGCVAFYSRVESEPLPLLRLAGKKTVILSLWVVGAFGLMTLIESLWINS
jgi:hypothetical protein